MKIDKAYWRGWWKFRLMPFWCGILGLPYFCPFEN